MKRNSRSISIVTIVTLLCLIVGAFSVVRECCKIAETGMHLIILNDNAQFYNEQYRKTDTMTDDYNENNAERQAIYHSEDATIRIFSNLPTLMKLVVWLLAIVAIPFVPYAVMLYVMRRIYAIIRINKQRRRKVQRDEEGFLYKESQVRRIV